MIEEILHITSCYIPSLAKRFFVECNFRSLKEKMFLKKVVKGRTTKPRFARRFLKDIKEQLEVSIFTNILQSYFVDAFYSPTIN